MKKLFTLVLAVAVIGVASTYAQCSASKKAMKDANQSTQTTFDFASLTNDGYDVKQCSKSGTYSASKTCDASGKVTSYSQCSRSGKVTKTVTAKDGVVISKEVVSSGKDGANAAPMKKAETPFSFAALEGEGFNVKQCAASGTYSASKTCSASGNVTNYNQCSKSGKITKTVSGKDGVVISKEVVSSGKDASTSAMPAKAACSKSAAKKGCCKSKKAGATKTAEKK